VGLAARPFGGIIFGYIGDKYSRKKMLAITILLMSIPTLCIGFLPTYEQIGIAAPISLIILRIIQGVALGGEFGASCVYLYESVPQNKRGFLGSFALTGVGTGLVLSACTILIVESWVTKEALYAYAWRIPFFVSVVGSLLGFYMRKNLLESPDFLIIQQKQNIIRNPLAELFRNHKVSLLSLFAIFLTTQISFFVVFIFGKTMMIDFLNYDSRTAGKFNLLTMVSYTLATIGFGYLSDKINKRYIILLGTMGIFVSAIPFIYSLESGASSLIFIMSLLLGTFIGMTEGTLNPIVAETFPTNIRATSVAFCWNFTAIAFGGVAPILSMWLIQNAGGVNAVAYYLMCACIITMGSTLYTLIKFKPSRDTRFEAPSAITVNTLSS
jgi:MHS family proline/betaine transporter-like MFS transporter